MIARSTKYLSEKRPSTGSGTVFRIGTKTSLVALLVVCLGLLWVASAAAQGQELNLSVNKVMGSQMGADIQGQIAVNASGPGNLASVTFLLDGQEMGTANQAPFRLVFNTDTYTPGRHELTATGRTGDGRTLTSAPLTVNILSASQAMGTLLRIVVPLLVIVAVVMVLGAGGTSLLAGRGAQRGLPQSYGISGGAICSRCGRPFALNPFNPNIPPGKLARCPYCGKWSIVRRASRQALEAAAASEVSGAQPTVAELSPEEKLRKQLEESRYQ